MDKAPDAFRTISETADLLGLEQHVLRFWETRFSQIKPLKRGGGRRYYRPDDVDFLRGLQHLLHVERFTIKGVQKIIREQGVRHLVQLGRSLAAEGASAAAAAVAAAPAAAPPVEPSDSMHAVVRGDRVRQAPAAHALTPSERERLGAALEDLINARRQIDAALGRA